MHTEDVLNIHTFDAVVITKIKSEESLPPCNRAPVRSGIFQLHRRLCGLPSFFLLEPETEL